MEDLPFWVEIEAKVRRYYYLNGGADGIRTHYLLTASQTLSQLSYSPTEALFNVTQKGISEQQIANASLVARR